MAYALICCVCGKEFHSPTLSRKFCSALCKSAGQLPDVPLTKAGRRYMHTCAICGAEFETSYSATRYCAHCRSRPYTEAHDAVVAEYKAKFPAWQRQRNAAMSKQRARTCKRCYQRYWADTPGHVCPDCLRTEEMKRILAMREPREPSRETYAEYQRRTNPTSMYADGRHLDELIGIKKRTGVIK